MAIQLDDNKRQNEQTKNGLGITGPTQKEGGRASKRLLCYSNISFVNQLLC